MNKKSDWIKMPEEYFETLSFGELKVGQRFIFFPSPGDNHGHGGFKGAHYIFVKTDIDAQSSPGVPFGIPTGRAINCNNGHPSYCPHTMSVILVE